VSTNDNRAKNVLYYGAEEPCPDQVELHAGPLDMVFEAGDLRWIRLGDHEIARRIYVAVRDRNWDTLANRISNPSIRTGPNRFEIRYDVENREREIDFRWVAHIVGDESGTITFSMRGTAHTAFLKNRIGFCLLHPIKECAGRACRITRQDGAIESGQFPLDISPHQPFLDFQGIAYSVDADTSVQLSFEGDMFEMEDQRNWTDASFKTYCTPLRLPYPAPVAAGTVIEQTVRVSIDAARKKTVSVAAPERLCFSFQPEERTPLPALGLGISSEIGELDLSQIELLRGLNLSHLRVDLDLRNGFRPLLERGIREAGQIGVPLEAALFLPAPPSGLKQILKDLADLNPLIIRWLVLNRAEKSTSMQSLRLVHDDLRALFPETPLVSGTNNYFAELNRGRPELELLDGVCYSLNPQVHAFDNDSLVESVEGQRDTVKTAKQFAGGLPIYVTPVTLRPRFNPNVTGPEPETAPGKLPRQVDVRQMSLFGAGWTVGSLKYLAEAGAAGITYYETCGWRGVMERTSGSPRPTRFRSVPGGVFPLFHVLADAGELKGGEFLRSESSAPLSVDGLVLRRDGRTLILLANMRGQHKLVSLGIDPGVRDIRMRVLDETTFERATRDPKGFRSAARQPVEPKAGSVEVTLRPYGVARLDYVLGE